MPVRATIVFLALLLGCARCEEAKEPEPSPVEEVLAALDEKSAALGGYTASAEMSLESSTPEYSVSSTSTMTVAWKRSDEQVLYRVEMRMKTDMTVEGTTTTTDGQSLQVVDGEYSWTESQVAPGMKMVYKAAADGAVQTRPSDILRGPYPLGYTSELLEDAELAGVACRGVELTSSQELGATEMPRRRWYFSKEHGILMKQVAYHADGRVAVEFELKDLQIDPDLDDALFSYEPPKGATVIDQTGKRE